MTLKELCARIALQQPMIDKMEATKAEMDLSVYSEEIDRLAHRESMQDAYEKLKDILGTDEGNMKMFVCQMEAARRLYDRYQQMGIADEIFDETMKCFTRFAEECYEKTGSYYFDRGWWSYRQVGMSLFRIGVLEYEFIELDGEKVLSMHIPSDSNMKNENVAASLHQAKAFMAEFFPEYADVRMYCHSWLLAPKLQELLPETSNIVKFQKRFTLTQSSYEGNDCVLWVFKAPSDTDVHDLREDTSLQRKIKALMLEGGSVGYGAGFITDLN